MLSDSNQPPTPRALSDVELQEVLEKAKAENAGILVQMQILEAQAQLREQDKSELAAWRATQEQPQHEAEQEATAFDELIADTEDHPVIANSIGFQGDESSPNLGENDIPDSVTFSAPVAIANEPEFSPIEEQGARNGAPEVLSTNAKSDSQLWVWLAISGSLFPFGVALWLQSLALTFQQSVFSVLLGIFVSAGVIAVGAIAGKRSSLPTLILSRATFGVFGNIAPASFLVISRLFWALILVLLGYLLIGQNLGDRIGVSASAGPVSLGPVVILALLIIGAVILAGRGGRTLYWAQRVAGGLGVVTAITLAVIRISTDGVHLSSNESGSWLRALGAAVLIFALYGMAWSSASADYASRLKHSVRGWKVAAWTFLALGLVPSGLAILGLLVFSNDNSQDFSHSFIQLAAGSAGPLAALVLVSLIFSLITVTAMSLKSSSMSFEALGLKFKASLASPVIAILAAILAIIGLYFLGATGVWANLESYALVIAVPVAAWSGIFVSDVLIRRIAYHEVSLSRAYGFYRAFNWVNLFGWAFSVAIGLGLLKSELAEFQWLGYLSGYASNGEFWAESNLGLAVTFALALLFPVAFGIPRIKRQEAEVLIIEARRNDLKDVLGEIF